MSIDTAATRPMTTPQLNYIRDLSASRNITPDDRTRLVVHLDAHVGGAVVQTTVWADTVIKWLKRRDKLATLVQDEPEDLVIGVYQYGGTVYVVKPDKRNPDRLAAYRVTEINGRRLTHNGTTVDFELQYARGMVDVLRLRHRMPLADAEAFMIRYSRCICCGRHLSDAESVAQGIGPVCRTKFFG